MKLKVLSLMLCAFGFVFASTAVAQDITVSGTVVSADDGEPLPGVTVMIQGTSRGTATDTEGNYELSAPANATLTFSSVGFATQEIPINGRTTINVEMAVDIAELGDVVVTGYGEFSKRNFTGSVSQVSSEDFEEAPVTSIEQALEGNVAGANISASTGTPGAVQQVRIRGLSSINAGVSPLYVIDGVPVVSGSNAVSGATSSLGVLANLSPSDIASVTVLKDAASTAPYGARGSNGVIVIETKDGQAGDVTYSVNIQRGYSNRAVEGPQALGAEEWDQLYYDASGNYIELFGFEPTRANVDALIGPSGWDGETRTNWGDVVTNDDAITQEYRLSAQGGNQRTQFFASTSFFEQEGAVIGSALDRYTGKFNITHQLDDRVTLTNNFNGSFVEQNGILEGAGYFGSPVLAEYFMLPIDRAYNEDGSPNISSLNTNIFNPVYVQNNDIDRKRNSRLINNTNLDIQILENLSFTSNFSIDYILTEEKYYDNPFYGDGEDVRGAVDDINSRNFNYVWRNNLNYIYQLNDDNIFDFKLISESQKNYSNYLESYGEGIAAAGLYNLSTTAVPQFVGSTTTDWAIQSFTGLVNYTFDDKVLVDLSLRQEGNSRFSEDKRWGTFWSAGAGYILTEDLLTDIDWLDFLKVRASYGLTGNASIGLNNYQTLVGFGAYNDQPNIQPVQLGNPNLTWEEANSLDLALEFEVFSKVDGSFTFFRKDSRNLLFDVPLSRTTGHNSQIQNSGELYNQGIEIELNANVINTQDFSWNVGGNFTLVKNEVTNLPTDVNGDPIEITTSTRYRAVEGYEVDAWFMREWAGVDPDNGDPLWYVDDGNGGRTTTNDYNSADLYYQGGNAQPTEYGAFNTRIDVFGFYASANISYAFGHKVFDNWSFYMQSDGAFSPFFGQYRKMGEYWQEPGDQVENPKPYYFIGNNNSNSASTRFLYDGDYLRLKSLNIGYNIPSELLSNVGLKSATVYFNGRNLWTHMFDEDLQYDPEQKASGFTSLSAQPMKSLTFGIKANF